MIRTAVLSAVEQQASIGEDSRTGEDVGQGSRTGEDVGRGSRTGEDVDQGLVGRGRDVQPGIGWDLTLHPKSLNMSFWRERVHKYTRWDQQVSVFTFLFTLAVTLKHLDQDGVLGTLWMFGPAWINQIGWMLVMWYANGSLYRQHRLQILKVVKFMLAVQSMHATNQIRDKLYNIGPLTKTAPAVSLYVKIILISNAMQFPAEVLRMPLPLWQQLWWTALKAGVLFLGGCTRDLVRFSNTPTYLQLLDNSNTLWARVVQSSCGPLISAGPELQGRSASMVLAMLTISVSSVAVTMYISYMFSWMELREWLRQKACLAIPAHPGEPACPVYIDGVPLTRRQLQRMCKSRAAKVLLEGRGVVSRTAMVLLHIGLLDLLCMLSVIASQLVALRIAPKLLPAAMMHMYYPVRPELEGGMCSPDSAPIYTGVLGRLLLALGP